MSKQSMPILLPFLSLLLPCLSGEVGPDAPVWSLLSWPCLWLHEKLFSMKTWFPLTLNTQTINHHKQQTPGTKLPLGPAPTDLLVGFFCVCSIWSLPTVVGLDGERVVLLQLTVKLFLRAYYSLTSGFIHYHCFKGNILPVDFKSTNLTYRVKDRLELVNMMIHFKNKWPNILQPGVCEGLWTKQEHCALKWVNSGNFSKKKQTSAFQATCLLCIHSCRSTKEKKRNVDRHFTGVLETALGQE